MKIPASEFIRRKQAQQQFISFQEETGKASRELPPKYSRVLAGSISVLVGIIIIWAAFAPVDETASASGEITTSTRPSSIPMLNGVRVNGIYVEEGQYVEKDTVLVTFDVANLSTEVQRLRQLVSQKEANLERLKAERTGESTSTGSLLQDELLSERLKKAAAAIEGRRAVIRQSQADLRETQVNLQYQRTEAERYRWLWKQGGLAELNYLKSNSQAKALEETVSAKQEVIAKAQQDLAEMEAEYRSEVLAQIDQDKQEVTTLKAQLTQSKIQLEQEGMVKAPVDGFVYNLKISETTVNVPSGEEILSIVPAGEPLILEAQISNKDIGFVRQGMSVKVKLQTFPFDEFGMVEGEVIYVSPNAIKELANGQENLVYPTRIKLKENFVWVRGEKVLLKPGMASTAEIVTRQRTVLTWLLSPIIKTFHEGFSAR